MSISPEQIEHLAKLARLSFSEAEKKQIADELNTIIHYVDQLQDVDVSNLEPLSHPLEISNILRADEAKGSLPQKVATRTAPSSQDGFFKVPKVIK